MEGGRSHWCSLAELASSLPVIMEISWKTSMTHTLNSVPLLEKKKKVKHLSKFCSQGRLLLSPLMAAKAQILILVWKGKMAFKFVVELHGNTECC